MSARERPRITMCDMQNETPLGEPFVCQVRYAVREPVRCHVRYSVRCDVRCNVRCNVRCYVRCRVNEPVREPAREQVLRMYKMHSLPLTRAQA